MRKVLHQALEAFLDEVERFEGSKARTSYEVILNDLIQWSEQPGRGLFYKPPVIAGKQSKKPQATVGFYVGHSTEVVWNAFPRVKDGAKIDITARESRLFQTHRRVLHQVVSEITGNPPKDIERVPLIPLAALATAGARNKLKKAVEQMLQSVRS